MPAMLFHERPLYLCSRLGLVTDLIPMLIVHCMTSPFSIVAIIQISQWVVDVPLLGKSSFLLQLGCLISYHTACLYSERSEEPLAPDCANQKLREVCRRTPYV